MSNNKRRHGRHGKNNNQTKINDQAKSFAKITYKKFKKDSWYDSKKETKEGFYSYLIDHLPGALEFVVSSGYKNDPEVQEIKNKILEKLAGKDSEGFIKYLYKEVKKGHKIDNIKLMPIVIKEIIQQATKKNEEMRAENPECKIYDMSNLTELSILILKKKIKKLKKKGVEPKLAFDILSVLPTDNVLKYSQLYRIKSLYDTLYLHARNGEEVDHDTIIKTLIGDKYEKAIIVFNLLERKERFAKMNDNEKALYLKISTWTFDKLESSSKEDIKTCLDTYIKRRKADEGNNKDSARRYPLATLSDQDYPKTKKIIDDIIANNDDVKKYL